MHDTLLAHWIAPTLTVRHLKLLWSLSRFPESIAVSTSHFLSSVVRARNMNVASRCPLWYAVSPTSRKLLLRRSGVTYSSTSCFDGEALATPRQYKCLRQGILSELLGDASFMALDSAHLKLWVARALMVRHLSPEQHEVCPAVPCGTSLFCCCSRS